MLHRDLVIVTDKRRGKKTKKSRTFRVHLLGYLTSPPGFPALPGDSEKHDLPVWIAYTGSDAEVQAFTANFRVGRAAEIEEKGRPKHHRSVKNHLLVAKSAGHKWQIRRFDDATVALGYVPELFHLEPPPPSPDATHHDWIFCPPGWWLDKAIAGLEERHGAQAPLFARATYFAAYLDRRSRLPILRDPEFHVRLYEAAKHERWTSSLPDFSDETAVLIDDLGFATLLGVHVTPKDLDEFLRRETESYAEHLRSLEPAEAAEPLPLLPEFPSEPSLQLSLF